MICDDAVDPFALWKDVFFFFNDTATTEIYTLSLHDALPISGTTIRERATRCSRRPTRRGRRVGRDRKSTRLNSSHSQISYAVFCLKKKNAQGRHPDLAHRTSARGRRPTRDGTPVLTHTPWHS